MNIKDITTPLDLDLVIYNMAFRSDPIIFYLLDSIPDNSKIWESKVPIIAGIFIIGETTFEDFKMIFGGDCGIKSLAYLCETLDRNLWSKKYCTKGIGKG